jgi:hypothetical protein
MHVFVVRQEAELPTEGKVGYHIHREILSSLGKI